MCSAECVLFCQPSVTHVSDVAEALHESLVQGQGASEAADSVGLNTLTPAPPWGARHSTILMGKIYDPVPIST